MVPLGDREVEMRKPTDGALVVLARVSRGLPKTDIGSDVSQEFLDRLIRNLGTLGKAVEGMIVQDADKEWLDDAMIDGSVLAEEVFDAIRVAGEKFNGVTTAKKASAVSPVRRRR
jgi:hypothetical protein